ncbi:MAG: hypothetical protein M3Y22_17705 [Pseudomonadota bacterium]|nr:hypothetical protein [Pseudomonadota bacterium]
MPRLLLDQNLPRALRSLLPGHEVRTAADQGWSELINGELLKAAEEAGFDVLVTADQGIRYQQNLSGRQIALIVLSTNTWRVLRDHPGLIADAMSRATPGSFEEVDFPRPPLRRRPPRDHSR